MKKILIIDDELEMCTSLSEILNDEGYNTKYSTDPMNAFSILKEEKIDLIIRILKCLEYPV